MNINFFIAHKIYKDETEKFKADLSLKAVQISDEYLEFCLTLVNTVRNHPNRIIGDINRQNNNLFDDLNNLILIPLTSGDGVQIDSFNQIAERLTNNLILLSETQNAKSIGYVVVVFYEIDEVDYLGIFKISDRKKGYSFENVNLTHELKAFNYLNIRDLDLGCIIEIGELTTEYSKPVCMFSSLSKIPPNYFINLIGILDPTNASTNTSRIMTECNDFFVQNRPFFEAQSITEAEYNSRVDDTLVGLSGGKDKWRTENLEFSESSDTISVISSNIFPENPDVLDTFLRNPDKNINPNLPIHKSTVQENHFIKLQHQGIKLTVPVSEIGKSVEIIDIDSETVQVVINNISRKSIQK